MRRPPAHLGHLQALADFLVIVDLAHLMDADPVSRMGIAEEDADVAAMAEVDIKDRGEEEILVVTIADRFKSDLCV
jgi:hypothetical protein